MFRAWSFQVTGKANLPHGTSTQAKIRLLSEHLSNSTAHAIWNSFTSVSTFCDESLLSRESNGKGLISNFSHAIHGYVILLWCLTVGNGDWSSSRAVLLDSAMRAMWLGAGPGAGHYCSCLPAHSYSLVQWSEVDESTGKENRTTVKI